MAVGWAGLGQGGSAKLAAARRREAVRVNNAAPLAAPILLILKVISAIPAPRPQRADIRVPPQARPGQAGARSRLLAASSTMFVGRRRCCSVRMPRGRREDSRHQRLFCPLETDTGHGLDGPDLVSSDCPLTAARPNLTVWTQLF